MRVLGSAREFALQQPAEQLIRVTGESDHIAAGLEVVRLDLPRAEDVEAGHPGPHDAQGALPVLRRDQIKEPAGGGREG